MRDEVRVPRGQIALLPIFAVSAGLLVNEIMLSAIFNVLLGAGNTVAAISIALVGLSAGGILAFCVPELQRLDRVEARSRALLFAFAVSLLASAYLVMAVPINHGDLVYRHGDRTVELWRIAVYHVTVLPFFLGGLVLALLFRSDPGRIGRLYFADLSGAAMGCVASPFLLSTLGAPETILAGAVPAALLASVLAWRSGGWLRAFVWLPALLLVLGPLRPDLLSFTTLNTMGEVNAPSYRSFPIGKGDIDYERWALDAWTIVRNDRIPQQWENFRGWGLSPNYRGPIPAIRLINYNARFSTYVTRRDGDDAALGRWLDADLSSLHHLLGRHYESVLNIGAGGGREVLAALHHGAKRVVAVDVSDVVVQDLMKDELREWSGGLYLDPRVEAVADEGRSFAQRSTERFDLVEFSIVGGMNLEKMDLVQVDDLFTVEALRMYLRRLSDDGVFSYVMYSTRSDIVAALVDAGATDAQPYIPALRTLTGLKIALERELPGARFADHVLVAGLPGQIDPNYDLVHIIASPRAFSDSERRRFVEECDRLGFSVLHPSPTPKSPYSRIAEAESLDAIESAFPFHVWPTTDDRPFQYPLDWTHLRRAIERGQVLSQLAGNPLVSMGLWIGALALGITLLPILVTRGRSDTLRTLRSNRSLLVYFACIGLAYMTVEIVVLLELRLFLGKPIYGMAVGLFAFLLASGIGSNFTVRLSRVPIERAVYGIVALILVTGAAFSTISGPTLLGAISWRLPVRAVIAVAAIFPMAFFMGMLFPLGISLVARRNENLIPWAWATNGCFSVIGIFGTRISALLVGFDRSLVIGLIVYALIPPIVWWHTRSGTAAQRLRDSGTLDSPSHRLDTR